MNNKQQQTIKDVDEILVKISNLFNTKSTPESDRSIQLLGLEAQIRTIVIELTEEIKSKEEQPNPGKYGLEIYTN